MSPKPCAACGERTYSEPEVGLPERECSRCDWIEGGESDFGFVELGDRLFCPLPLDGVAA